MVVVLRVVFFSVVFLLGACSHWYGNDSYFHNNDSAYLTSSNGRDLVVPPPLTKQYITNYFRLPEQTQSAEVSIVPPSMQALMVEPHYVPRIDASNIKFVKEGVMVAKPIAQTWSLVGSALKRKSMRIAKIDHKRFIYYVGANPVVRVNLFARGRFDTLITLSDEKGNPLTQAQMSSLRSKISQGMQDGFNFSVAGMWRR